MQRRGWRNKAQSDSAPIFADWLRNSLWWTSRSEDNVDLLQIGILPWLAANLARKHPSAKPECGSLDKAQSPGGE
jgi:hypothetical protein